MKATAGIIKLWNNLVKREKQNCIVNTKELLFLAMESVILLGNVNSPWIILGGAGSKIVSKKD